MWILQREGEDMSDETTEEATEERMSKQICQHPAGAIERYCDDCFDYLVAEMGEARDKAMLYEKARAEAEAKLAEKDEQITHHQKALDKCRIVNECADCRDGIQGWESPVIARLQNELAASEQARAEAEAGAAAMRKAFGYMIQQVEINDFEDSHGHPFKMLDAYHKVKESFSSDAVARVEKLERVVKAARTIGEEAT